MYSLGMDLGTSTVKIVLMQNGTVETVSYTHLTLPTTPYV